MPKELVLELMGSTASTEIKPSTPTGAEREHTPEAAVSARKTVLSKSLQWLLLRSAVNRPGY